MTKVDIFSGFLGAGKTTLIKKLIAEAFKGEKIVLIENEFGEIGIDGGFLKDSGIQITEMNSGCICCTLVGDFGIALKDVMKQFTPDRIIIEPSGVGKLSDVIKAIQDVAEEAGIAVNNFVAVYYSSRIMYFLHCFYGVGLMISPNIMALALKYKNWKEVIHGLHIVKLLF